MKQKSNAFKKVSLIVSFIMIALLLSSVTFSYWANINNIFNINDNLQIGTWGLPYLSINNNLSNDFSSYNLTIDVNEVIGQTRYDSLPQNPKPKSHNGVLQSDYEFDGWYFANGVKLTPTTIINENQTIYPSWNSKNNWQYSTSSTYYNITKKSTAQFSGDLYVPGWRYKGKEINSLSAMSSSSDPLILDGLWIGEGIKSIANNSFRYSDVSSLVFEEGIESIGNDCFRYMKNSGSSLIIPDSLTTISQYAFRDMTYSGSLEISENSKLESIGTYSFADSGFSGSLYLPSSLKSMGNAAFKTNNFTGTLNMKDVKQLNQVNQFVFSGNKFNGDLTLGGTISSIGHSAFNGNLFDGKLDLSEANDLTLINDLAFQNTKFTSVDFPLNGVLDSISTQSFQNNKIGELRLPRSLTNIAGSVFAGNPLKKMYVPLAFVTAGGCGGLKNITIYFEASTFPPGWNANWENNNIILYNQTLPY